MLIDINKTITSELGQRLVEPSCGGNYDKVLGTRTLGFHEPTLVTVERLWITDVPVIQLMPRVQPTNTFSSAQLILRE